MAGEVPLTSRQVEILAHYAAGRRPRQIAGEMHLSFHTIRHELVDIRRFYGTSSITAAVASAIFDGLVERGADGVPAPAST